MAGFKVCDKLKHPKMPEWGIGKVLEASPDGKVKVFFINAREKTISLKHVVLEKVVGEDAAHPILDNPNFKERATKIKFDSLIEWSEFKPTKEKYKQALRCLEADGHFDNTLYRNMLRAQYESDWRTITATSLAKAVGYVNYNAANLQYGTMGKLLAHQLGCLPPKYQDGERRNSIFYCAAFSMK